MVEIILGFFGNYLIEFMMALLASALVFRYLAYRHSKDDEAYYSRFTRELDTCIDEDKQKGLRIDDVDSYLSNILGRVNQKLPTQTLRFRTNKNVSERSSDDDRMSLGDYVGSKHGLIASIQGEGSIFNCQVPPDFTELTDRVMNDDKNWTKLFGHVPIEGVSRMIDILPNLFIVFGVFGTFIGIAMALPEIANLDFNNLEGSSDTLTRFVINVAYAMKTSIAGIAFSLVLTFLNTFFPIQDMRERTFKKVETTMQILWYHIQNDSSKDKIIFPQILEVLKEISQKLNLPKDLEELSKRKAS
ncbi:MAG: hypothetical protein BM556_16175 [Bacteriovorax sp. MedPE-SWde]|nr:MAG: hypothetical protein BM556_16175 [Bacteriovorax sp. MedPE-SWde]